MSDRPQRLGDVIDDYCPRCRLLLNHDISSLSGTEIAKVTCRTCHNSHDYRHAQVPTRRKSKKTVSKKPEATPTATPAETPPPSPPPSLPTNPPLPTPTPALQTIRTAGGVPPTKGLRRDMPYGIPVPNRPGLVTSPYSPKSGYVDVRGIPSGTEVKDPYTGKIFLTP